MKRDQMLHPQAVHTRPWSNVTRSRRRQKLRVQLITPVVRPENRRPPQRLPTSVYRGRDLRRALTRALPGPANPPPPSAAQWRAKIQQPMGASWNLGQPLHQTAIYELPHLTMWTSERPPSAHFLLMPSMPRRSAARREQMQHPQAVQSLRRSDVTRGRRRQKTSGAADDTGGGAREATPAISATDICEPRPGFAPSSGTRTA